MNFIFFIWFLFCSLSLQNRQVMVTSLGRCCTSGTRVPQSPDCWSSCNVRRKMGECGGDDTKGMVNGNEGVRSLGGREMSRSIRDGICVCVVVVVVAVMLLVVVVLIVAMEVMRLVVVMLMVVVGTVVRVACIGVVGVVGMLCIGVLEVDCVAVVEILVLGAVFVVGVVELVVECVAGWFCGV